MSDRDLFVEGATVRRRAGGGPYGVVLAVGKQSEVGGYVDQELVRVKWTPRNQRSQPYTSWVKRSGLIVVSTPARERSGL